jgi:hypothetical protein
MSTLRKRGTSHESDKFDWRLQRSIAMALIPVFDPEFAKPTSGRDLVSMASAFELVIKSQSNWAKFAKIEPARLRPSE